MYSDNFEQMDFKPRHPQPFTIQQVIGFDVSVIDQGVAKHQYSLSSN